MASRVFLRFVIRVQDHAIFPQRLSKKNCSLGVIQWAFSLGEIPLSGGGHVGG